MYSHEYYHLKNYYFHNNIQTSHCALSTEDCIKCACNQGYATRAARLVVLTFVDANLFDLGGAIVRKFHDGTMMVIG